VTDWVSSSYCDGGTCAEISWQRSSFCEGGSCTDVALTAGDVLVRDGKDPDGAVLRFSREEWAAFVAGVKAGEFDR
jgi:hypothetical protein